MRSAEQGKIARALNYSSHVTQSKRSGYHLTTPATFFRRSASGRLGSGQSNRWNESPPRASASKPVPCPERMQGPGALEVYRSGCRTAFVNATSVFHIENAHPISGQNRALSTYGRSRFPAAAGTCRGWRTAPRKETDCFLNSSKNEHRGESSCKAPNCKSIDNVCLTSKLFKVEAVDACHPKQLLYYKYSHSFASKEQYALLHPCLCCRWHSQANLG